MKFIYRFILLFSIFSFALVTFLILTFLIPYPAFERSPDMIQKIVSLDFEIKKSIINSLSPMIALLVAIWTVQRNYQNSIMKVDFDRTKAIIDISIGIRSELRFMRSVLNSKRHDISVLINRKRSARDLKTDRFPSFEFLFFNKNIDKISLLGHKLTENVLEIYYRIMIKCKELNGASFCSEDPEAMMERAISEIDFLNEKISNIIDDLERSCRSHGVFIGSDKYECISIDGKRW